MKLWLIKSVKELSMVSLGIVFYSRNLKKGSFSEMAVTIYNKTAAPYLLSEKLSLLHRLVF